MPGNCLFAALADQYYADPARHPEVRKTVIEYMRANRADFEFWATIDDIKTRRPTRGRINAAKKQNVGDKFEEYLARMSTNGTYGGQPELVAFCRAYDRDILIHRPEGQYVHEYRTSNDRRADGAPVITLNISYGSEDKDAHYDSVRTRDGHMQKRRRAHVKSKHRIPSGRAEQIEAVRKARPSLASEDIENFFTKSQDDLDANFQALVNMSRARSSSNSSSQRSSSSKRSLEADKEPDRATKRADRRKSLKKRAVAVVSSLERGTEVSFKIRLDSQEPSTPTSTQDTEYSSDPTEANGGVSVEDEYHIIRKPEELSDSDASLGKALAKLAAPSSLRPHATKGVAALKHRSL